MRSIYLLTLTAILLSSGAFADTSIAELQRTGAQFGLSPTFQVSGIDANGRKCEVKGTFDSTELSVEATKYLSLNSVENAYAFARAAGVSAMNIKVQNLKVKGSASSEGQLSYRLRDQVTAHRTDYGMHVPAYEIDHSVTLLFNGGNLVSASVETSRPGFSKLVVDPDYRGGSVQNCRAD